MSLNDIQLKDFIVAEWYKDALLESPDGPPAIRRPATTAPASTTTMPPAEPATVVTETPAQPKPAAPQLTAAPTAQPVSEPVREPAPTPQPISQPTQPVQAPPVRSAPQSDTPAQYKFLGKNARRISILVDAKDAAFLPDDQLNFLSKILEACRMNVGDVAIVNHAAQQVNITALRQQLEPSVVLLFGIDPTAIRLPINFPEFKLQPYDDCTYLLAPSLAMMVQPNEEARQLKGKLWGCLKTLFQI